MKKTLSIVGALCLSAALMTSSAATLTFSDGTCTRDNAFRVGATTQQGIAIKLSHDKLSTLKDATVKGVSASFGSSRTEGGTVELFITTALGGTPIVKETVSISRAAQWLNFTLSTPYTITGNEPDLYIGYTGEIATTANLLMADLALGCAETSYVYNNGKWDDLVTLGKGNANIKVDIDGAPEFTDMVLKPMDIDGYYNAQTEYTFAGQIFNFGTTPVTSLDMKVSIGDEAPTTRSYTDINIAPGTNFDFTVPANMSREGKYAVTIEVTNVNGDAETLLADNNFDSELFFYPKDMERTIFLEGFTGQACGNCPEGHRTINSFLDEATIPVVEVMHHSGYQPDFYSMKADYDYTFFYGSNTTFAPAFMMNRTLFPTLDKAPVLNTTYALLAKAHNIIVNTQPYVSLNLESTYDPATRQVDITFATHAHNDLPAEQNVLNVFLLQDGLVGNQSAAGDGYTHNCVFRGTLTGNSWGVILPESASVAGGELSWTHSFTLPESIFSDYYDPALMTPDRRARYDHAVVPENMKIVAFVGAFGSEIGDHQVYNAIEVKLGESHAQNGYVSGIENVATDKPLSNIAINVEGGKIAVSGDYDSLSIHDVSGKLIPAGTTLGRGVYIVRATSGSSAVVKKILVK